MLVEVGCGELDTGLAFGHEHRAGLAALQQAGGSRLSDNVGVEEERYRILR